MNGGFLIILIAMVAIFYLLLIRPQQAQKRRTQEMLNKIAPGDEVITIGGIYGDVVEVEDDKVVLEIAEDVHIEVTRRAIANVVPPESEIDESGDADEADEADEDLDDGDAHDPEPDPVDGETVPAEASESSSEIEERAR